MAKSVRELLVPILFLVEGAFWLGIVATGGAFLLVLAGLAFVLSGVLLYAMPSGWVTRPLAGASAELRAPGYTPLRSAQATLSHQLKIEGETS